MIDAGVAAIAAENLQAIERCARQVIARALVGEFVRGNNRVEPKLQLALLQQSQARRVKEKRGSVFGAGGASGKGDPEAADALFA